MPDCLLESLAWEITAPEVLRQLPLTARQKQVVLAVAAAEGDQTAAAEQLGCSVTNVSRALARVRALAELRGVKP